MNDLISRLSEIRSDYNCMDENDEPYYRALSEAIQLASAQLERTGKWVDKDGGIATCSACGDRWGVWSVMKFCPNCGARMESNKMD